ERVCHLIGVPAPCERWHRFTIEARGIRLCRQMKSRSGGPVDGQAPPPSALLHGPFEESPPGRMTAGPKSRPKDLRRVRRPHQHGCWDHLIVAPLWVAYEANLGTLLRTCDAVGACMAVPDSKHYRAALAVGDTLFRRPHIHSVGRSRLTWVRQQRDRGSVVVA